MPQMTDEIPGWNDDGSFQRAIKGADRINIRDGGYNCCHPVTRQKILVTITNIEEITSFGESFVFKSNQGQKVCLCCGYPGIDWYLGKKLLALTALQHGHGLRWKGFPGDISFTKESSERIVRWLKSHGITS
jgi:hypothetical protein